MLLHSIIAMHFLACSYSRRPFSYKQVSWLISLIIPISETNNNRGDCENIDLSLLLSLDTTAIHHNPRPAPSSQSVVSWARIVARQSSSGTEARLAALWTVLEVYLVACQ
jgi:hypothetical protein